MNILYHHRTQAKGVEGVHIKEIVKALTELGNSVDVLSPAGVDQHDLKADAKPGRIAGIYSIISRILPEMIFELLEIFYNFKAAKSLSVLIGKKKYDLIYERYAIFNWAGVRAAKRHKIPVILEINYTSFMPLYRKRSGILKPFAHRIDKKILKQADGLVAVSTYLKKHLVSLGVDKEKIIVSTNAADPVRFSPDLTGREIRKRYGLCDRKVIGFVGGFYPWHGLDFLIDCYRKVKGDIEDAVLFLIGDGPLKEELTDRVRSAGLEKEVIFAGKIEHEKLPEYIASFDIAVMPDSNKYGSPMKIYEYMAAAKPVIAPGLGPLEDGIANGEEGLLFRRRNEKELSSALKLLLSDKKLRDRMGRSGRENIISRHTWQKNAESILRYYSNGNNSTESIAADDGRLASSNTKKRILFITPRMPYPPIKGDILRPYNFIKELAKKHTVDLCTFYQDRSELENIDEMKKYCNNAEAVFLPKIVSYLNMLRSIINFKPFQINYYHSREMAKKISQMSDANGYDIVHIVTQRMMSYTKHCNGEKMLLDQIDALSLNMHRRASTEKNIIKRLAFYLEQANMVRQEKNSKQRYNACIVTSSIDKDALDDDRIEVIPNGVNTDYFAPMEMEKDIDLIFTGNMGYFPNVDAACYLCKEILPKVLKTYPELKLYIVGARPDHKVRALADNKNVFVTGPVDDIRPYLNRARIFVAPLRSGSGIQNKILEAMACGLPVVTTSYGNAGIKAEDGEHLIVADKPQEFADILVELIADSGKGKKYERLGKSAQELVRKDFSWNNRARLLETIYESVC